MNIFMAIYNQTYYYDDMNEDELKNKLSEEEYHVLREKGTEAPFTGKYWDTKESGVYACKACGQKLFESGTKFDSGTGWPSFYDAVPGSVEFVHDNLHGMERTEVLCSNCKSHLGHVFDDGVGTPTGKRFCMNSVCLDLQKEADKNEQSDA
jgi:peptide-methionine (R)-S-oxide reductase